jgi:hypothetical protein
VTSPKNLLIVFLLLITAATGIYAWQQQQSRSTARVVTTADKDDLSQKLADARRRIADLEARLATLQATAPATAGQPATTSADATTTERRSPDRASQEAARRAEMTALFNDPEVVKLMASQQKVQLDGRYASLFKQLNLTPTQLETFKNLLLEKQIAQRDVMVAARESGLSPRENREELRKLVEQSKAETDAEILAMLGQEKFNQYKTYESTGSQRALVEQIGRSLSYSPTPLTDAQSQALVQIFSQNTAPQSTDGSPRERFAQGSITITDAMIAQAQRILAPDQVKVLQEQQAAQQASAKLQELMREVGRDAGRNAARNRNTP